MLEAFLEDLELGAPAFVARRQVMQLAGQNIGDVMFLVALEDDVACLGVGFQCRVQDLLLYQLVEVQFGRERFENVSSRAASSLRGFFPLLQQLFEAAMIRFEQPDGILLVG